MRDMTNTTLLGSLAQLIKQRLTLTAKEQKLAEQELARRQFLTNVAHELRTRKKALSHKGEGILMLPRVPTPLPGEGGLDL